LAGLGKPYKYGVRRLELSFARPPRRVECRLPSRDIHVVDRLGPHGSGGVAWTWEHPKVIHEVHQGKPGGALDLFSLGVLALVWVAAASGTGFLLALLARWIRPSLSLVKLWFLYSVLMALLVAFVFLMGWL